MAKACTFIGNRDLSLNEQWALRPRLQQAIFLRVVAHMGLT